MRQLEPELTVERYLARMPNADLETGRQWARCLAMAGLPIGKRQLEPALNVEKYFARVNQSQLE